MSHTIPAISSSVLFFTLNILNFQRIVPPLLFGGSAAAEVKDGQQTGAAVSADNYAERSDFDFTDHRELRTDRRADKLGVIEAVGVENVYLGACAVDLVQVAEHAVGDVLEGVLSAADFFGYVESSPVGNIEYGFDIQKRAYQRRCV